MCYAADRSKLSFCHSVLVPKIVEHLILSSSKVVFAHRLSPLLSQALFTAISCRSPFTCQESQHVSRNSVVFWQLWNHLVHLLSEVFDVSEYPASNMKWKGISLSTSGLSVALGDADSDSPAQRNARHKLSTMGPRKIEFSVSGTCDRYFS